MGFALPRISWRERAPEPRDPPGVVPLAVPQAVDGLGWLFTFGCIGFLLYFTFDIARDQAVSLHLTRFLWWTAKGNGIELWLPLVLPYVIISVGVPIMVKFMLPMFMFFNHKKEGDGWPKFWSGALMVLGSLVIIAGSIVVQNNGSLEKNRDGAVRVEQAVANRAAKEAELTELRRQLSVLVEEGVNRPTIEGKAAREGAAGWPAKVAAAKAQADAGQPVDVNRLERAQSAALAADGLRDKITSKIGEVAAMPTTASVQARVVEKGDWATELSDELERSRKIMLALVSDLAALFCTWLAMRLLDKRNRQLADWEAVHSEPVPEAGIDMRITDQTDQWQPVPNETTYDPDTGDELIPVRRRQEVHYRRKPKRKKDDAQAPLNATDSRAPVENEVELGDELDTQEETPSAVSSFEEPDPAHSLEDQKSSASDMASGPGLADEDHIGDVNDMVATRTAYESSFEGQGQDEVDEAEEDQSDGIGGDVDVEGAPYSLDTESAVEDGTDGAGSLRDAGGEVETPLPNGEGVLVRTDEEIEELERQYAARRATEAAE